MTDAAGGVLGRFLLDPTSPLTTVSGLAVHDWPAVLTTAVSAAGTAATGRVLWHRTSQRRLTRQGHSLEILVPATVDPAGAHALWAHLRGLLRPWWRRLLGQQPHLAFEYHFTPAGLSLRLWSPSTVPLALLQRAVEAAWPGAHTRPLPSVSDNPVGQCRVTTGGRLRLARPDIWPIEHRHDADPLRALLGAGQNLDDGEHLTVQILARPATGLRLRRAKRKLRALHHGSPAPARPGRVFDLLAHRSQRGTATRRDPERADQLRAALTKTTAPLWDTTVYYTASAPASALTEQEALHRARGRAHQTASAFAVYAGRNWYARHRLHHPDQRLAHRHFPLRGDLLSVPELAAIAHLPLDAAAPGVTRAGARCVLPPARIPEPGPDSKPLGRADLGPPRGIALGVPDGRHHLHVMGATGSGKSTLLANLVLADADAGRGALVVDPKGDLVLDILARLPEHALTRTVVLDPADTAKPPRLNVLEAGTDDADVVVDNLVGIFRRIFTAFWGPRTDDVMRAACLTLIHTQLPGQPVTLADIPHLLTSAAMRHRTVARLHPSEKTLRGFWNWYEQLSEPTRASITSPLMNKLRAFLLRTFVSDTIAAGASTFDLADVLDGGIALVRLPKGVLGEETARLLGSFVVAKTWQAAARRAGAGEHTRRDATLVLDECHNFLTLPYPLEDMLAEARGYRLSLVLAHQNQAQLPADLREGISANARNKIFFNCSPEDARQLERHTAPLLTAHDLAHLGAYQAATRLVDHAADQPAFTLTTRPLPAPIPGREFQARAASRRNFGPTPPPAGSQGGTGT
ncbi:type IV secretion system DNA-binding domain-containing protein [Streptacidiphilus neutrinimicus]|uniref:type IV secretion system DNA-binding domain-containing protein n=1 Tax=Streptacidiphilus neutrinimicus TaxID=105420 RepID=UPI0005AA0AB2|nr:type IV secretion system DNA-binding domain-containing protein [Streptacidiphilus neutrinimicus]